MDRHLPSPECPGAAQWSPQQDWSCHCQTIWSKEYQVRKIQDIEKYLPVYSSMLEAQLVFHQGALGPADQRSGPQLRLFSSDR